jgi:tetratricopeptide (TPR) repeat protein
MGLTSSRLKMVLDDRQRRIVLGLCLFLVVSIAVVYGQTTGFSFVDYDDPVYVSDNPRVLEGLTWDGVKWAFTTTYRSYWAPLIWLSLMLNREIFGVGAGGFHLVNVVLHIANTVLLFWVLRRYSGALWSSFFAAAIFGLHPLRVESVAWITERKDVLSALFWMLTMLAYVRYLEGPTVKRYVAICVLYALGLMAKPMLVTLPFVLLIMDYWPLQRLRTEGVWRQGGSEAASGVPVSRLILEKLPLIVLSMLSSMITVIAAKSGGAIAKFNMFSFGYRIGNALVAYCDYILKMFRPVGLAVLYPHPWAQQAGWKIAASVALLLAITAAVILLRRRRYLLAGWLWYLGTLVPVIGLVQVGEQAMADRFTYIPLTGVSIMLVWAVADIVAGWRYKAVFAGVVGSVLIAVLGVLTFRQVGHWRDTITLFTHAAAVTTDNYVAHSSLGVSYAEKGDIETAMREFEIALKMKPKDTGTLYNVAKGLALQGRTGEAIECYNSVLALAPGDAGAYYAIALIEADRGEVERAISLYRKGLEFHPENGDLHGGLGSLLLQMGRVDEAIVELETAVRLKADSAICANLGMALLIKGDSTGAMMNFNKAIRINPNNAEAHYNLGNAYLSQSRLAMAAGEYRKAIGARPNYAKAYGNLAVALASMGESDEAIKNFRRVVELEPNSPDAYFNLAGILADKGLVDEAIGHLRKVVELVPQDASVRCELARLLLQQGKIEQAIAEYEGALKIDPANKEALAGLQKARDMQAGKGQPLPAAGESSANP